MASPLVKAVKRSDAASVRELLKAGADPNEGPAGVSLALWTAAHRGNTPMVVLLLEAGAKAAWPVVHAAAFGNHANTLRVLLASGAPTDAPGAPTPLLNLLKYSGFTQEQQSKVRQLLQATGARELPESYRGLRWSVMYGWRWRLRRFAYRIRNGARAD